MIFYKSPTRVDLSGGTLDLWPLYNFVHGAQTINLAIDIWTSARITPHQEAAITIESLDYNQKWNFKNTDELLNSPDAKLCLFQAVLRPFFKKYPVKFRNGFTLQTKSESPIGGGLGGSSSLVISMLKAFSEWTGHRFKDSHEMVLWAHNIEAEVLNTPTGTQDYYPAVAGGLNYLTYATEGISQKVIDPSGTPLVDHFLLVNTGRSHHSGLNNFEVLKSSVAKESKVLQALHKIKKISDDLATVIQEKAWSQIPELFQQEFSARLELTPAFSSPEIEKLAEISMKNGAKAVKICGAGGGGCVLVWVPPNSRQKVISACEKEKFQCLPAKPVAPIKNQE